MQTVNENTNSKQMLAAKISIFGWIVLILISLSAGIITDSVTLILDASQGLVTLVVAFLVRITLEKIDKPPDDFYHFGYGKYEPLTIALQGVMIILTCIISIKFAVQDIFHPDDIDHYDVAIIAAFLAGIISLVIASYIRHTALKTGSDILKSSSLTWLIDCVLSFGIFIGFLFGLILNRLGYTRATPYVDPVMAIILALFFIAAPLKTIKTSIFELLDAAPAIHIRDNIKKIIEQCKPQHFAVDRLRIRKAGRRIFLDICFITDENLTVRDVRHLTANFEKDFIAKVPGCDIVIHHKSIREKKSAVSP